jgi:hypothetical protein
MIAAEENNLISQGENNNDAGEPSDCGQSKKCKIINR